jgi:hypothetical protein
VVRAERRVTLTPIRLTGANSVCVECKLTEPEVGRCSRTAFPPSSRSHCDEANPLTAKGLDCPLADRGPKYWDEAPVFVKMDERRGRREWSDVRTLSVSARHPGGQPPWTRARPRAPHL